MCAELLRFFKLTGFTSNSAPVDALRSGGVSDCGVPCGDCGPISILPMQRVLPYGVGNAYMALAVNVSNGVVFICTRRSLELHVTNVVACLDDDPPVQVYLETALGLARVPAHDHPPTYISLCSGSS